MGGEGKPGKEQNPDYFLIILGFKLPHFFVGSKERLYTK